MNLEQANLYPTDVRYGMVDFFTQEDLKQIQDMMENRLRNKQVLNEIHSQPANTDPGLFELPGHIIMRLKDLFEKTALEMHESVYPNMKDKFRILDTTCTGVVHGQMTHDTPRCHVPWMYSGMFTVSIPSGLAYPEGSVTFLDPRPYSAEVDLIQLEAKPGMLVIFPSWQRYVVNPIKKSKEYQFTLIMNTLLMHDTSYKENVTYVDKTPSNESVDVLNLTDSDSDSGEVDIGRF
jgi:hypothetical protein